jgi:HEPN domain-containing protein
MPERRPPDDPTEWLNRARSNLALARMRAEEVYLEDLCFNLQQAAEKAIKALLIKHGLPFPYVHDIGELLRLLEDAGQSVPVTLRQSVRLTRFAVFTRYPGVAPPISYDEYHEALMLAEAVVNWVAQQL